MCVCVCVFVCLCLGPSGPVDATTLADGSNNGIGERERKGERGRDGGKCVRLKELVSLALFTQEMSLRTRSVLQEGPENKLHLSKITTGKLINSKQPWPE